MDQASYFTLSGGDIIGPLAELDVDPLGRPLNDPDAIRAGIPAWHPRNDVDGDADSGDADAVGDGTDGGDDDGDADGDEGKTFDAAYVAKLRKEAAGYRKRATDAEAKVKEREDAEKSDQEKLSERLSTAEERAAYADRLDVALDKAPEGMSLAQVRKLAKRITGSTKEELEADAEELFSEFAPSKSDDQESTRRSPRERLRPGAAPSAEPEETDPRKLAASIPRF